MILTKKIIKVKKMLGAYFDAKKLNLNLIQEYVINYQINRDKNLKEKIIQGLSRYLWHYPQLAFKIRSSDTLSDFYIYVYERIDKVLDNYQSDISKLSTYLAVRLKTYWFNFCKQQKVRQKKSLMDYPLEESILLRKEKKENLLIFSDSKTKAEDLNETFSKYFDFSLASLKENQKSNQGEKQTEIFNYLTLKLFFFDFFNNEDFIILKNYLNESYSIVLEKLEIFRQQLNQKRNDKMAWELRLNKIFYNLNSFPTSPGSLEKNKSLRLKIQEEQEKILHTYYHLKLDPDIKTIAMILQEKDERKIWNVVTYYKRKIQKKY